MHLLMDLDGVVRHRDPSAAGHLVTMRGLPCERLVRLAGSQPELGVRRRVTDCRDGGGDSWLSARTLVATAVDIGFINVRKGVRRASDDERWRVRRAPPDYRGRRAELAVRSSTLDVGDRVHFVYGWAASSGQVIACKQLTVDARAHCIGGAVLVDSVVRSALRRDLNLRSVIHLRGPDRLR